MTTWSTETLKNTWSSEPIQLLQWRWFTQGPRSGSPRDSSVTCKVEDVGPSFPIANPLSFEFPRTTLKKSNCLFNSLFFTAFSQRWEVLSWFCLAVRDPVHKVVTAVLYNLIGKRVHHFQNLFREDLWENYAQLASTLPLLPRFPGLAGGQATIQGGRVWGPSLSRVAAQCELTPGPGGSLISQVADIVQDNFCAFHYKEKLEQERSDVRVTVLSECRHWEMLTGSICWCRDSEMNQSWRCQQGPQGWLDPLPKDRALQSTKNCSEEDNVPAMKSQI